MGFVVELLEWWVSGGNWCWLYDGCWWIGGLLSCLCEAVENVVVLD